MLETNKTKRQKCEVYTRVMGYLRPVSHYNLGKKSEFYSRLWFSEEAVNGRLKGMLNSNREFIKKFSNENQA